MSADEQPMPALEAPAPKASPSRNKAARRRAQKRAAHVARLGPNRAVREYARQLGRLHRQIAEREAAKRAPAPALILAAKEARQ